jgi:hypothetical protein
MQAYLCAPAPRSLAQLFQYFCVPFANLRVRCIDQTCRLSGPFLLPYSLLGNLFHEPLFLQLDAQLDRFLRPLLLYLFAEYIGIYSKYIILVSYFLRLSNAFYTYRELVKRGYFEEAVMIKVFARPCETVNLCIIYAKGIGNFKRNTIIQRIVKCM